MNDFNYQQKAVDLDRRLEKAMESHTDTSSKTASPEDAPLGLQAYLEQPSISEEIAMVRSKAASQEPLSLDVIRAREKIADIVEERASRFDDFSALAKPAVEHFDKVAADEAALDNRRTELRSMTPERS